MTHTIPHTSPQARSLHDICELASRVPCGYCWADRGEHCGFTGTTSRPLDGWHLTRFGRARRKGLLEEDDLAVVLEAAATVITAATIVWCGR